MILRSFNNFFCNVGANLAKKFEKNDKTQFKNYLRNPNPSSLFLEPVRTNEITNLIVSLNIDKSVGHDDIPAYFLRIASHLRAPALCHFYNSSFQTGVFPSTCKFAEVVPVYKADKKKLVTNYRPILILSCFFKVLEKLIYTRMVSFLNKHGVINTNQYGF